MTIELSEYVIDAIADAIVKKMQEPTKEEKALLQKWHDNRGISMKDFEDAMDALEQEPKTDVLDKIRAEIMDFEEELFHKPNTDYADYAAVRHCVEIIDKYKAESEARNDTNSTADL